MPDQSVAFALSQQPGEWLDALPAYQRELIEPMLSTSGPAEVAAGWMDSTGHANTAPFGAVKDTGARFYTNTLKELQKLLCGGEEYEEARTSILSDLGATKMTSVAVITASISPSVGVSAVVLAPAVVLTLTVLSRAAGATACETLAQMIALREPNEVG